MKQRTRMQLVGKALTCVLFIASSCTGRDEDRSQYIYETDKENLFVREFIGDSDSRPDFIYSPSYPNGRIVTYYAHWCPHCIHFKPKYISLSNEIHEMSQKSHVTLETFAVSCVPQRKICNDNDIHGYPTVMFYPPNSIAGTKLKHFQLNLEELLKISGASAAALEVGEQGVGVTQQFPSNHLEKQNKRPKSYFISRNRSEAFHDAHLSFDFAMKTAIFTQNGPLPEKPKKAFREFLLAMKKTVPSNSSMQPVVRNLLENFETISKSPVALGEIMTKYPPTEPTFKWSQASMHHGTGYTAGLWTLFHIMSVGLVHWNHITKDDEQKLTPAAMADILRNYVEHFFQCEECRLNFLADFDACMYDRCNRLITTAVGGTMEQYIQYPLWLYETHNAVNIRLRKERIEQNLEAENFTTEREVVWPPFTSCPSCWPSKYKDRWDEVEVYKFLQQSYWLQDHDSEILRVLSNENSEGNIKSNRLIEQQRSIYWDGDRNRGNASYRDEFHFSLFVGSCCCFVLTIAVFWYRRRRYDQKGIHKKVESSLP